MKDIGVYAIGNIGSKLITFLMVPLYTYFVHDTGDFGYYDVCLTLCFLLVPFVTLQLRDGAFRFLLDSEDERKRQAVVSFTLRTLALNISLGVVAALVISGFTTVPYLGYAVALLVAMSLQEVFSQVFRGLGHNKAFVTVGILSAFGIGVFSVVFVAWMGMGIKGIFLSNILARVLALAVVEARVRLLTRHFSRYADVKQVARDLLRYSLPLIPGSLCWWLTGSSDRFFILHYLGLDVNGVYAVAARFTGIVQTLAIIFYQAWQETAILQYDSPDRDRFFSRMFNGYIFVLGALLTGYTFLLKICYGWLVDAQYQESLLYIYPLGLSSVIFAVVAFFDMGYQCTKDTARTLPAVIAAAAVNVALNFLLIKPLGVWGVVVTLNVTYLVLVVWRWHDMKRYFNLRLLPATAVPVLLMLASLLPFYLGRSVWIDAAWMVVVFAMLLLACPKAFRREVAGRFAHKFPH